VTPLRKDRRYPIVRALTDCTHILFTSVISNQFVRTLCLLLIFLTTTLKFLAIVWIIQQRHRKAHEMHPARQCHMIKGTPMYQRERACWESPAAAGLAHFVRLLTRVCPSGTHRLVYRVWPIKEVEKYKDSKIDLETKKEDSNPYSTRTLVNPSLVAYIKPG
jgi:hypothetical protein